MLFITANDNTIILPTISARILANDYGNSGGKRIGIHSSPSCSAPSATGQSSPNSGIVTPKNVPCSRTGASYHNCITRVQANPYSRGCSSITRCRSP
ncbi:hypothetical protein ACH5RR_030282 [Cinchona calisaya]|uniref:Uncharacterized protein n=1 Tax=Cinchona calisaya TaxID=153742 RepID=A0ABD2YWC6_9GENT